MSPINIAVIVGSLRRDSFNAKLATAIAKLAPAEFTLKHSQIGDLPLYNQDDDANQAPPVKRLKTEIAAAHGLLFVTPEYNRSVQASLRTPSTTHRGLTVRVHFPGNQPASSVCPSTLSARRSRSSISGIPWPISTSRPLASPRHLSRPRKACSVQMVASAPPDHRAAAAGGDDEHRT